MIDVGELVMKEWAVLVEEGAVNAPSQPFNCSLNISDYM